MKKLVQWVRNKYRYSLVVFQELVKTDFQLRYQGSFLGHGVVGIETAHAICRNVCGVRPVPEIL